MTFSALWPTILCGIFMLITLTSHLHTRQVIRRDATEWDRRMTLELTAQTKRMTADLEAVTARTAYVPVRAEKTLEPRRNSAAVA